MRMRKKESAQERIYLDYAASTPADLEVLSAMEPYWRESFANPWSAHREGRTLREKLEEWRTRIGKSIGIKGRVDERNLVFTSSGTESNSLALRGVIDSAHARGVKRPHVVLSAIEHASVAELVRQHEELGIDVDVLPVNEEGIVVARDLRELLREETVLVSVMLVNSEIGTIQPLKDIAREIRVYKKEHAGGSHILLHSDASQALAWMSVDVEELGVDLLSVDAHKMYGPKGVAALYVSRDVDIMPLFIGSEGGQYYRPGTPAMPLIAGFTKALEIAERDRGQYTDKVKRLRDTLLEKLQNSIEGVRVNGSMDERVCNNLSVSIEGVNHDFLQTILDERGVAVASKSACLEMGGEGSAVLAALGGKERNALRITLGKETTQDELDRFVDILAEAVQLARA